MWKRQKSAHNQKINTFMRLVTCQRDFDTHNSSNSVWLTPKLINPIWFIAMGQKQDRKYQNQEMSTFFFALDYVLESLQKSRLYVNNKKSSITRENAFLRQIEQLFLVKSNIDSNRRKTYSLASKTSSEFRDKHFCADNYFPELLQRTKLCGNDKRVFLIKR